MTRMILQLSSNTHLFCSSEYRDLDEASDEEPSLELICSCSQAFEESQMSWCLGPFSRFTAQMCPFFQGCDLLKTSLRDNSERVVTSAQQILLPSFAVWAHELGRLEHSLMHTILRDLEELVKAIPLYEPRQANLCLRAFRHDKFQLRMPSHSEGPGIWLSVWRFLLIHCLYERAAEVLARLRGCAGSPEPSLLA